MARNHYTTLGVKKDATKEDIKKAYRKKAQETHPDKGGNGHEFSEVSKAYHILSNDRLRIIYDETGNDTEVDNTLQNSIKYIKESFMNLLASVGGDNFLRLNFIKEIKDDLKSQIKKEEKEKEQVRKAIIVAEKLAKKLIFKKSNKYPNVIQIFVTEEINKMNAKIFFCEQKALELKVAIEIMELYKETDTHSEFHKEELMQDSLFSKLFKGGSAF